MTWTRKTSTASRSRISTLLVLALLFRGLIPDGYMPAGADDTGDSVLQLCPHSGGHRALMASPGGEPQDSDTSPEQDHRSSCPFSVLLIAAPLPVPLDLPTVSQTRVAAVASPDSLHSGFQSRPALPPRGPPVALI